MNLVFKPKVSASFEHLKDAVIDAVLLPNKIKPRNFWTDEELEILANLRSINIPLSVCAKHLRRSINSCGGAVHKYDLYATIAKKRKELIHVVLNG